MTNWLIGSDINQDQVFLVTDKERVTFGQFCQEVGLFGDGLSRSVAFFLIDNSPEFVIAYAALAGQSVVPLILDPRTSDESIRGLMEAYRPRYLVVTAETEIDGFSLLRTLGNVWLLEDSKPRVALIHPDLALLQQTSGSTGSPKAVRISRDNIESVTGSISRYMNIENSRRFVAHLPFHYVYGLSILHLALLGGCSLYFPSATFIEPGFWHGIQKSSVTDFSGVPFHYQTMWRLGLPKEPFGSLRCFTQAGGKLDEVLVDHFFSKLNSEGIDFFVMYGQAEASPRMSYLGPSHPGGLISSVGRAIDIGEFSIDGSYEGVGEVVYSGTNVCMGYARSSEDLAIGNEFGGKLKTGDIGYLDSDGNLTIRGRQKRMVKVDGASVYLDEVEASLSLPGSEVFALGRDGGVVLVSNADKEALLERMLPLVPGLHPSRLRIERLENIPKKSSGKIDYPALEGMFL